MSCVHPKEQQRFMGRTEQWRLGVRFYTDMYVCDGCGREQPRLILNPQSVAEVQLTKAVRRFRTRAGEMLNHAVELGLVERPEACEKCGTTTEKIQGHHYDYGRPLEVEWLCQKCHSAADDIRRAAEAA